MRLLAQVVSARFTYKKLPNYFPEWLHHFTSPAKYEICFSTSSPGWYRDFLYTSCSHTSTASPIVNMSIRGRMTAFAIIIAVLINT